MKTKSLLSAIGLAITLAGSAQAVPSGSFSYAMDSASAQVWDLSGTYHLSPTIGRNNAVGFDVAVVEDSKGQLSGAASNVTVTVNNESILGSYVLKGKVFRAGKVTKVSLVVKVTGTGTIQGQTRDLVLLATYALKIDTATGTILGVGHGNGRISGLGTGSLSEKVNVPVPAGATGAWILDITLANSGKNLTGTGTATFPSGRVIDFTAKGLYNSLTGKSTILLSGTAPDGTNKIKLVGSGDSLSLLSMRAILLGQTVSK